MTTRWWHWVKGQCLNPLPWQRLANRRVSILSSNTHSLAALQSDFNMEEGGKEVEKTPEPDEGSKNTAPDR